MSCAPPTTRIQHRELDQRILHGPLAVVDPHAKRGLRYEFARSPIERDDKSLVFAPELGQILLAGEGVRRDIVDPDWNNFAPRLGFTWRPPLLEDAVVRGGAGICYATDNFNEEQFKGTGPPFFQAQTIEGNPQVPNLFMRDMMPSFTNSPNVNPFTFDRTNRTPYLTQWSLGGQKSLGSNYLLEIDTPAAAARSCRNGATSTSPPSTRPAPSRSSNACRIRRTASS